MDSIATNIVEGCAAESEREFARYLAISIKSAAEAENHMLSARDRRGMTSKEWEKHSNEVVEIRRMTDAYRERVLEDDPPEEGDASATAHSS